MNKLNRDQAIAIVGLAAVDAVEARNCEPTGRAGYNGVRQGDSQTEWCASVNAGDDRRLEAIYYTSAEQDQTMADAGGDGAAINWTVDHYVVI